MQTLTNFSLILPFHNKDLDKLIETLGRLKKEAGDQGVKEIILGHNGRPLRNEDEVALSRALFSGVRLVHTDAIGIGAGYKAGLRIATGDVSILSASDLPFGWTDLDAFKKNPSVFAIGSKAHRDSVLGALSFKRRIASYLFWLLRRILLGRDTPGDSQGSLIVDTKVARKLIANSVYDNYLFSLELICLFQTSNQKVVELPVVLENCEGQSSVSVSRDGFKMVRDLFGLAISIWKRRWSSLS